MFLLTLEIDTPPGSRKTLYPLRKLTIFNGVLHFRDGVRAMAKGSAMGWPTTLSLHTRLRVKPVLRCYLNTFPHTTLPAQPDPPPPKAVVP
jgi:hypothetical protein